ncbi:MAG: DUF6482 family protein [Spongiibacteraceae bacterium]
MKLLLEQLPEMQPIPQAVIASIDMSIYQLFVVTPNGERLVWKNERQPLTARSIGLMREEIKNIAIESVLLRHNSAYDEMINQPLRENNTLEVRLRQDQLL